MSDTLDFGTLDTLWRQQAQTPPALAYTATTQAEWADWHHALKARVVELLGGFPVSSPSLEPRLLEVHDLPAYRLEKVAFQSEPGIYVPCYVLVPHDVQPPYQAVIALSGHGSGGVAHILGRTRGVAPQEMEIEHIAAHNYDYAHHLALRGFLVFAPEQRGFGERMEDHPGLAEGSPLWRSSCRALAFNALLMGRTLLGMRVWDVMRTLDYIATRDEETTERAACLGLSGGGTTTLYAAALEPRLKAAVVSGAFSSFRSSIMSTIHCDCNYVPGILQVAEMADLAALIAPRCLLIEAGTEDPIFPIDEVRTACAQVAQVYRLLDVPDRFDQDLFAGGHRFSGAKSFDWLARWLS